MRGKNPWLDYTEVREFRSNLQGFFKSGTTIHSFQPNFASISFSRTSHMFMRKLCRSSGRSLQPAPARRHFVGGIALLLAIFALSIPLAAQQADASASSQTAAPSAPAQPAPQSQAAPEQSAQQTKRILGIIPNFRAVSSDTTLPPQSVKDKFLDATHDSFDYSSFFIPAALAGYSMARDTYPEFHQGGAGYARYFWHAAVDQTSENYMVEFIVPVITHEDTRYYTLGHGSFLHRTGYALSRAVVTRSDSGREVFNISEVVGAGAASGISSCYYPSRERSFSNTASEWGLDVGIDAASFVFREFWPDINRSVFRGKQSQ
jgi:hypothetical protein